MVERSPLRVNSRRGEVRLEYVRDALRHVELLEELVDERVGQHVVVSVDPLEIHPESTALKLDGKLHEEDREEKGRGEKSLDRKAVALVVRDPGDGELRRSEVRGGGVVVKREEEDERHKGGHEFPGRDERLVSNPSEQLWPIARPEFQ